LISESAWPRRDRVALDFELIRGNRQQRIVGDRGVRVALGDGLKVLDRFGVLARAIEVEAALELAARLLLHVALCARQRDERDHCKEGEPEGDSV
jgi:hypothetical protein